MGRLERLARIQEAIRAVAEHPRATTLAELERILNQLEFAGYAVSRRPTKEGVLFTVEGARPFGVCDHHPGDKHIRVKYVKHFLGVMIELGLLED